MNRTLLLWVAILLSPALRLDATNYEENKVGTYQLPNPLVCKDGTPVTRTNQWFDKRRPEILELYHKEIFGFTPHPGIHTQFNVWENSANALEGKAVRKQIEVNLTGSPRGPVVHLLLYTPAEKTSPVPTFLCLQFQGNYTVIDDPGIAIFPAWDRKKFTLAMPKLPHRGELSNNWNIPATLARGYGFAVVNYQEIEPDMAQGLGFQYGAHQNPAFDQTNKGSSCGAIGAWAWGTSRLLDYLETDKDVDAKKVILFGHSRLGKTALWAGAEDTRFAAVIASCSGEMGAALSRRDFGETVDDVLKHFPYWMCGNFSKYRGRWNELPIDSHCLLALIAPRPLFLSTGSEDLWGDPHGEFLAAKAATPVYELVGKTGISETEFPPLDHVLKHDLSFNCHAGKHDVFPSDWDAFLDFADAHFSQK